MFFPLSRINEEPAEEPPSTITSKRIYLTELEKKDADLPLQVFQASLVSTIY